MLFFVNHKMNQRPYLFTGILFCFTFLNLNAQTQLQSKEHLQSYRVQQSATQSFNSENPVTAIAITCDCEGSFQVMVNGKAFAIPRDPDAENPTYFISLPNPANEFSIIAPDQVSYKVFLIQSGNTPAMDNSNMRILSFDECAEPLETVPQSEWRAGLSAPNYNRSFHEVNHNIVHHSAGSNSSTNYVQVVRDIYLYHTEVNGWSDIGYNYLISQDGTVFNGRDPDIGSQDEVRGAHFCGSNTGTLGICLLGNYETAIPTAPAITSLESMLTYQLLNQDCDPFESFSHPLGDIGSIAGHRDGCATLCPGENVYSMLNDVRQCVAGMMEECNPSIPLAVEVDTTLVRVEDLVTFNAIGSYENFHWLIEGIFPGTYSGETVTISFYAPGKYDVRLVGNDSQVSDTLLLEDYIKVSLLEDRPVVFPNPVSGDRELNVDFKNAVNELVLYNLNGQTIKKSQNESINLFSLMPGIYLLEINSESGVFRERVIKI